MQQERFVCVCVRACVRVRVCAAIDTVILIEIRYYLYTKN
jgi:hypothetical protein